MLEDQVGSERIRLQDARRRATRFEGDTFEFDGTAIEGVDHEMAVAAHPKERLDARTTGDAGDTGAGNGNRSHAWEGWLFEGNTLRGDCELARCSLNTQGLHRLRRGGGYGAAMSQKHPLEHGAGVRQPGRGLGRLLLSSSITRETTYIPRSISVKDRWVREHARSLFSRHKRALAASA